jgi:two-component system, NarL family, nitrate/nitrite sensor histidine kinase NarX
MNMFIKSPGLVSYLWDRIFRWSWSTLVPFEQIGLSGSHTETTWSIQQKEQHRIARQLHDTLGHDLALLCMKLDQLSNSKFTFGSEMLFSEIESMHNIASSAYEQVRNLMSELRGETYPIFSPDWISHVNECALLIGKRAQFAVNIVTEESPIILPSQMQSEVLYLVRETLRNIEKHAHATNVTLTFKKTENGLSIRVSDDGRGFDLSRDQEKNGHHGLRIIQEIVSELHGSLFVESGPAMGTQILLWLPFNELPV